MRLEIALRNTRQYLLLCNESGRLEISVEMMVELLAGDLCDAFVQDVVSGVDIAIPVESTVWAKLVALRSLESFEHGTTVGVGAQHAGPELVGDVHIRIEFHLRNHEAFRCAEMAFDGTVGGHVEVADTDQGVLAGDCNGLGKLGGGSMNTDVLPQPKVRQFLLLVHDLLADEVQQSKSGVRFWIFHHR